MGLLIGVLLALSPAAALAQTPDDEYDLEVPAPGNEEPVPPPEPEPTPVEPAPEPAPPAPAPVTEAAPVPEVTTPEAAPVTEVPAAPEAAPSVVEEKRDQKRPKDREEEEAGPALIPPGLDNPPPSTFSEPADRSLSTILAGAVSHPTVAGLLLVLAAISAMSFGAAVRKRRLAPSPVA